ncbi:DUF3575 domain-containing protein [Flavobacterium restrictum]|uniref:DUF3575 domain-containing protein n=1 Tax=Flavobacterium restrictum TaxID=2594428 RepID=A0A553DV99_9FLAO|nr:DUF3575 domain-containing protein [Flavobacterium restrictum]TRX36682.1 DUF3575 domain-containing protein [Flavobacterium restrictum]
MKKIILLTLFVVGSHAFSQENETALSKKNELKGNALFLVLGAGEISYERLINDDSGLGISMFFINEEDFDTNFSLSPYYRAYFGKKPAAGFFVEGFSMISTGKNGSYSEYNSTTNSDYDVAGKKYSDLALGFGIGSKWVHKRGFVFEINAGIGRNLFSSNSPEVVGRGGITLGYRF